MKKIMTVLLLFTSITMAWSQSILGKWKNSSGDKYEFKNNTAVLKEKEFPAEYRGSSKETVVKIYTVKGPVNYVGRFDDRDTISFITPEGRTDVLERIKEAPAEKKVAVKSKTGKLNIKKLDMVKIPGKDYEMLRTEVTQELYEAVMGVNPSFYKPGSERYRELVGEDFVVTEGENAKKLPVNSVNWYDAIYFCNKLSVLCNLKPVYSVHRETDIEKWGYAPNETDEPWNWDSISYPDIKDIRQDASANGYRLPSCKEWQYAANGGESYLYSGSNSLDEVAWCDDNSYQKIHEVAKKRANGYGLYDMNGNVMEWCWSDKVDDYNDQPIVGGCFRDQNYSGIDWVNDDFCFENAKNTDDLYGFRIVRSISK